MTDKKKTTKKTTTKKPATSKTKDVADKMLPQKKTYVSLVLDSSGSMGAIRDETISGFNEQIRLLKENATKGGEIYVSLVVFGENSGDVSTKFVNKPVNEVEELTYQTYVPSGMTPMYDGVGTAIASVENQDAEGDVAFLVITISDGMENYSKEYSSADISSKVKSLQGKGNWTFVYIGANQDLGKASASTGINAANVRGFKATQKGTKMMFDSSNVATANYLCAREVGVMAVDNYWENVPEDKEDKEDTPLTAKTLTYSPTNSKSVLEVLNR